MAMAGHPSMTRQPSAYLKCSMLFAMQSKQQKVAGHPLVEIQLQTEDRLMNAEEVLEASHPTTTNQRREERQQFAVVSPTSMLQLAAVEKLTTATITQQEIQSCDPRTVAVTKFHLSQPRSHRLQTWTTASLAPILGGCLWISGCMASNYTDATDGAVDVALMDDPSVVDVAYVDSIALLSTDGDADFVADEDTDKDCMDDADFVANKDTNKDRIDEQTTDSVTFYSNSQCWSW